MEIKYLIEQDNGDIILPVVHTDGIVGLKADFDYAPDQKKFSFTPSKGDYTIDYELNTFEGIVAVSMYIELNNASNNSILQTLSTDGVVQINLNDFSVKSLPIILSCVAYNGDDVSSEGEIYCKITNGMIFINGSVTKNIYRKLDNGEFERIETLIDIDRIICTGYSILI